MAPGVSIGERALANRPSTFEISGPKPDIARVEGLLARALLPILSFHNAGCVRVFAMAFLQAENEKSVEWFLRCFKDEAEVTPKFIAMDASYSIMTAARRIFVR